MKERKADESCVNHDAAIAAGMMILEEFFPHCPNGLAGAIHERVCEIIEAAIESAERVRWRTRNEPSRN